MAKLIDITGKALSGEWGMEDENGTGIPVLRTTNFTNDGIVNFANVVTRDICKSGKSEKFLRKGDIIIEKSGGSDKQPVGRVIYFEGEENKYLFNNFTGLLRVHNQKKWVPKFVFYSLFANYRQGGTRSYENKTTGLHNLKLESYIQNTEIKDYGIEQQNCICTALDQLRKIIILRKTEIEKLDELIKARFVEMFGTKDNSEYPIVKLGDYANLQGGYAFKSKDFIENGLPLVQIGNVNRDGLNWDIINSVPVNYQEKFSEFLLLDGDIVMAMTRPIIKAIDSVKIAKITKQDLPCLLNQRVGRFQIKKNLHPTFLMNFLKMKAFKNYVELMSGNSLQPNISSKQVEDFTIILPPLALQERFAEFVAQIDKSKLLDFPASMKYHNKSKVAAHNLLRIQE